MADQPLPPDPDPGSNASSSPDADPGSVVSDEQSLNDVVALARDLVLYAPIALVLDAPTLLPKLAEQGKVHVRNARVLGPHALRRIHNRLVNIASNTGRRAGRRAPPPVRWRSRTATARRPRVRLQVR